MNVFIETIKSSNEEIRNRSFFDLCEGIPVKDLIESFEELEKFRQQNSNLYDKVRAEIFLYAGYKFVLMNKNGIDTGGIIPVSGYKNLLERNFEKSISEFRNEINRNGYNANILSALAESYHKLAFQSLANQVKKSVKQSFGNRWMFRVGHPEEHPLKIHPLLMQKNGSPLYPVLRETSAVRMDLTHNCWSDIFFLGMDFPEGAKVINISIDLGVYGRDNEIKPPIETYLRVIDEPVIRLTSIDLNDTKDITELTDLFNFANDYLGLLKAGIIASGLVPPSFESTVYGLEEILSRVTAPGMGIEIVTKVNDIPKGSRLAVSTNLLASIISLIMRATKQTNKLEGELTEQEKRLIVSRAILGEWLGGSGGGWQDSGGIWAGIKIIEGVKATEKDPEFNISRGCLLPKHKPLTSEEFVHKEFEQRLLSSLILFHGGMASNVGPVLEMVTEKYLLRSSEEWKARQFSNLIFNEILEAINRGDIEKLAQLTSTNFDYPIKTIIPEATNHFTELIIRKCKEKFGDGYKGFLMLGGISGGGMGMFVEQGNLENRKKELLEILYKTKNKLENALPFAMDPVVYNFQINKYGSLGKLLQGNDAVMPLKYYSIIIPSLLKGNNEKIPDTRKIEFDLATEFSKGKEDSFKMLRTIVGSLFRFSNKVESFDKAEHDKITERIKKENGFDFIQHEDIRKDLIRGKIGLARNRLAADTIIEDVKDDELLFIKNLKDKKNVNHIDGKVAVLCLAAGVGSRWTKGAGVVKAINPFIEIKGKHRSFLEIHLAKNENTSMGSKQKVPFIISTSYLTNDAVVDDLIRNKNYNYSGDVYISRGQSIGQRFIPMERDLRYLWEELHQEKLEENKQKVLDSFRKTMIDWAKERGEGNDYKDNIALQRLNPIGHWYEIPNTFKNGTLKKILTKHPGVEHIMLHNIDTLGAYISEKVFNYHLTAKNVLTFEVIERSIDDRGGGLAKINGRLRILEGLAQPNEEDELKLRFYNSMTTWINIDELLNLFGLSRTDIINHDLNKINNAIRDTARRVPTYVTIKDVKYRWGNGQEDIYPVAQVEKLWSDMSGLSDIKCGFVVVPRYRGQQLKDPAQLNAWLIDGSKEYVESLCNF